ncbi:MAG: M48 family metalloprotease [Phycisphaerales bacterium]|nr:M48 family metalloprotease [Phycisphaerales bacterium]
MHRLRPLLTIALLVAAAAATTGCKTNVATGRSQFTSMSREEEIQLGTEAMPELIQEYGGEVSSTQLRTYVTQVGTTLAQHTEGENPSLPWQFTVLDSDVINAFALPGGKVFITSGLMAQFTNEAQLAATLGHEVGHVSAKHVDERITQSSAISTLGQIAGAVVGYQSADLGQLVSVIVGTGGQGYLLKFGRDQESEADALGVRYMVAAGYNPTGMLQVLEVLKREAGGGSQPEILSTHPYPETRLERVNALLKGQYASSLNNPSLQLKAEQYAQKAKPYLPAPKGKAPSAGAVRGPEFWCAHCREAAARAGGR